MDRHDRELLVVNAIAQALNRSVDLAEALRVTLAQVAELFDLQTGWVWLLNETSGVVYLAAAQNLPPALAEHPRRMEGSCYCLDSFCEGDLAGAANVNIITCTRLQNLVDGTDGLRFHASVPLYAQGKQLGVLNVASTDWRKLAPDDLRLLYIVGDLLGIAIERARLFAHSTELGVVAERNRLAREIHDTLAQGLSAIALQLETADALLDAGTERARLQAVIQQALLLTRANLEEARRSVHDLRAAPLQGHTLPAALAELCAEINRRCPVLTHLEASGSQHPLPVAIEAGLYRLAQEALENAHRHAQASQVQVQLLLAPNQVYLSIQDDGVGFDPANVPHNRYGLVGMNERVKLLGGELHIQSSPGQGTKVEATVPL